MRQTLPARLRLCASLLCGLAGPLATWPAAPAWAADPRPHLCKVDETPVFSCATGRKIVSLCASENFTPDAGRLTYRFGTKRKIELTYPDAGVKPQAAFKRGVTGGTGGGADFLRFTRGGNSYVIFSDHYRGHERDGLVIERNGAAIAVLICKESVIDPAEAWAPIYKTKLPSDSAGFEVP